MDLVKNQISNGSIRSLIKYLDFTREKLGSWATPLATTPIVAFLHKLRCNTTSLSPILRYSSTSSGSDNNGFLHLLRNSEKITIVLRSFPNLLSLRGLTIAGGVLGNQVKTSLTTSKVLYKFKKFVMPLATTSPVTESPGKMEAKLCVDKLVGLVEFRQRI